MDDDDDERDERNMDGSIWTLVREKSTPCSGGGGAARAAALLAEQLRDDVVVVLANPARARAAQPVRRAHEQVDRDRAVVEAQTLEPGRPLVGVDDPDRR